MPLRRACAILILVVSAAVAAADVRYIVGDDYRYGGGSLGDEPEWRAVTWVWRSEAEREACRRSIFTDRRDGASDPLGTTACRHARLAPSPNTRMAFGPRA